MAISKLGRWNQRVRAYLYLPYRPRRAKRPLWRKLAILGGCLLAFSGIFAASAAVLTPKPATYDTTDATIEPLDTPSTPDPTPTPPIEQKKKAATAKPKLVAKERRKPVAPPKVIGTRYTCASLNVRAEAGLGAKIVKNLPARKKIHIMNRAFKDWRMVRFDKKNRWMYAPCLWTHRPPKPKPPVVKKPAPSPKKTTSPSTTTKPNYSSGNTVWDRLAKCESGGNWGINTGNGFYGGLQFTLSTWKGYGGSGYPHKASREEQIRIAKKVLAGQGWGAWPACSSKLGLR